MAGGSIDRRRRERLVQDCAALAREGHVEVLSRLARDYWDVPAVAMAALAYAPERRAPLRTVGIYYCRFGIGGVERVNRDLVVLWQSMGYRVVLISDERPGDDDLPVPPGVERAYVPSCFTSYGEAYAPRAAALGDVLARLGVDVLVYAQWLSFTLPWDALVARLQGVSFVVHTHGVFSCVMALTQGDFTALPPCYAHVDAVVCLSGADERFWRSYNANVFRTVNPLSPLFAQVEPARLDAGRTVLWVGRLQADKYPREALQVMERVAPELPDTRLVMVGPLIDGDRECWERRVAELGLEGRVELVGPQPESQMPAWYAQADVMLMTSHFEGYSLALQEAMSMGVPCVLYDMPYLTLLEGRRGVLPSPMGDVDALARDVVDVLGDAEKRRSLGRAARAYVTELQAADRTVLWREVFDVVASVKHLSLRCDPVAPLTWHAAYDAVAEAKARATEAMAGRLERLEAQVAQLEAANARLQGDLDAVVGSVSFKAGRALTAPLRKARDAFGRRDG